MNQSKRSRRPARLPKSTLARLEMYALAATASGVGVLALSQPANAKIIYTAVHKKIDPHQTVPIDLNRDGKTDFTLSNAVSCRSDICFYDLFLKPATANSAIGYVFDGQLLLASALKSGVNIGPGAGFQKGTAGLVEIIFSFGGQSTNLFGPWPNEKKRYLGLAFQINNQTHYGWARLNVKVNKTTIDATLTGYAYETTPNKSLKAGKTRGSDAPRIEPTGLGLLAQGVAREHR